MLIAASQATNSMSPEDSLGSNAACSQTSRSCVRQRNAINGLESSQNFLFVYNMQGYRKDT